MVLLTIQTNESFARDFGKHKFDKLFQYCTHELKAASLLVKHMHLQAMMASNSQSVLPAQDKSYRDTIQRATSASVKFQTSAELGEVLTRGGLSLHGITFPLLVYRTHMKAEGCSQGTELTGLELNRVMFQQYIGKLATSHNPRSAKRHGELGGGG